MILHDMDAFVAKVKEMREAQKDYFAVRAPSLLPRVKKLEKEVDAMLAAGEAGAVQSSLPGLMNNNSRRPL